MSRELLIERAPEGLVDLLPDLTGAEVAGTPACAESDPELFFPISEQHTDQIAAAKAVCAQCPLRAACLLQGLRSGDQGIWGGTTEGERRRLRRKQKAKNQNQRTSEGVQAA